MSGRVGLLGGTFDPPHNAHLIMAQTAREALGLEKIILLPAPRPPHKAGTVLSNYDDRLEMARIAARDVEALEVSDLEAGRTGRSYTVDTLRLCRDRFGDDLYFIMGADSLRDLPMWRDPQGILELCTLVVFPRGDIPMRLDVTGNASIIAFEAPKIDISSSDLRRRLERGESADDAIPDGVLDLIRERGLYRRH